MSPRSDLLGTALFDLADFEPAPVLPAYDHFVPQVFSLAYYSPAELDSALAESIAAHPDWSWEAPWRRMWRRLFAAPKWEVNGHSLSEFWADTRCDCKFLLAQGTDVSCSCVGELLERFICEECAWQITGCGNAVEEAWHDHVWPGWRDLPRLPAELWPRGGGVGQGAYDVKLAKRARAWIEDAYPSEWQQPGAPVLVDHDGGHIAGYSPWGGYGMAALRIETNAA